MFDGLGREAEQLELGLRPVEPVAVAGVGLAGVGATGAAVEEAPEDAPAAVRSAFLIRETPADESPRERLLCGGARALTDVELLAVLVQNGGSVEDGLDLQSALEVTGNSTDEADFMATAMSLEQAAYGGRMQDRKHL